MLLQSDLEKELENASNAYLALKMRINEAEYNISHSKPVFTYLKSPSVPLEKSGPDRFLFIIKILFISFAFITLYILWKEDDFIQLFGYSFKLN